LRGISNPAICRSFHGREFSVDRPPGRRALQVWKRLSSAFHTQQMRIRFACEAASLSRRQPSYRSKGEWGWTKVKDFLVSGACSLGLLSTKIIRPRSQNRRCFSRIDEKAVPTLPEPGLDICCGGVEGTFTTIQHKCTGRKRSGHRFNHLICRWPDSAECLTVSWHRG